MVWAGITGNNHLVTTSFSASLDKREVTSLLMGLGDKVPELKAVTSKFYAFLVVIHTQYMKSKH